MNTRFTQAIQKICRCDHVHDYQKTIYHERRSSSTKIYEIRSRHHTCNKNYQNNRFCSNIFVVQCFEFEISTKLHEIDEKHHRRKLFSKNEK